MCDNVVLCVAVMSHVDNVILCVAVMSALRGLQEKIRQLELDRTQAESNLRNLAQETTRYRDILQDEHDATNVSLQSANISASARGKTKNNISGIWLVSTLSLFQLSRGGSGYVSGKGLME